jgi:hypothetical protein
MKKHHTYKLAMFAAVLSVVSGCKSLKEEPISFVPPENFYSTPTQVEAAFAASMNQLWDEWTGYSDGAGSAYFSNDDQYYGGDLVISPSHGDGVWKIHYAALLNINAALAAIKKGNLAGTEQATIDELIGQARFLRAYNYFMLVRMFGGVPLITDETPDPVSNPLARSTVEEVYTLITDDFTDAIAKLPVSWAGSPGKPTKGAAQALLAKTYLTMATAPLNKTENYAKAAALALEIMNSGTYKLEQKVSDVFQTSHKYGTEMIWSFNSNDQDRATDPHEWAPDFVGGWSGGAIEPAFEKQYPAQPRKSAYLMYEYNGIPYTDPSWSPDNFPFIQKFLNVTPDDFDAGRSTLNLPIIRYADVLLIYAEAKNMVAGSPTQDAVDAINQVIDRANGYKENTSHPKLTTGISKGAFDTAVIEERSLELCFEMDRWFDLIRKRILKEKNPEYAQNFTEDDYLFPIPELDLRLNKKLVQNPGYPSPQ